MYFATSIPGYPHRDRVQVVCDTGLLLGDDTRGAAGIPGHWGEQGLSLVLCPADHNDGDGPAAAACETQRHLRAGGHGEAVPGAVHQLPEARGPARRHGQWFGWPTSGSARAHGALGGGPESTLIRRRQAGATGWTSSRLSWILSSNPIFFVSKLSRLSEVFKLYKYIDSI